MGIDTYSVRIKCIVKWKNIFSLISLYLYTFIPLFAQQKAVQYTKDFEFKDGVYLSILNFRNNNPIPVSKIIFSSNKGDKNFLKHVLDKNTFTYIDSGGEEQEMKTETVWGYCYNGIIHIDHGTDFNRVTIVGSICHFVATVPIKVGMSDPFNYNDPFYNPQQYTYVSEQFVIDYESGKVLNFNVGNMEALLSRDETLYKEFTALKKKQKRDSIFLFLRKYNEKHPIYFPE